MFNVCPEPVLVTMVIFSLKRGGKGLFPLTSQAQVPSRGRKSASSQRGLSFTPSARSRAQARVAESSQNATKSNDMIAAKPIGKTVVIFEWFPYVCPEPVLVKSCISYINGSKLPFFFHLRLRQQPTTARDRQQSPPGLEAQSPNRIALPPHTHTHTYEFNKTSLGQQQSESETDVCHVLCCPAMQCAPGALSMQRILCI